MKRTEWLQETRTFYLLSTLNIDGYSPPQVRYRQPIAIRRVTINRQPIYLHVPTSHTKQWKKYCRNYNACDERVLFVRSNWYNREYGTRYQGNQRGGRGYRNSSLNQRQANQRGNAGQNNPGRGHGR